MIFKLVNSDPNLFEIRRNSIFDEGVFSEIDSSLLDENGDLLNDKVLILKLDEYFAYNSRKTHNPPPVIDNLIIVKCCDSSIGIYMIELRNAGGRDPRQRLHPRLIEPKFITAAADFIGQRYNGFFGAVAVSGIYAYLVIGVSNKIYEEKIKLATLDVYSSRKPIDVLGRRVLINPTLPPNPVIRCC